MIRVFASLSIGLALMNFATLGLSEDDATKFLRYTVQFIPGGIVEPVVKIYI